MFHIIWLRSYLQSKCRTSYTRSFRRFNNHIEVKQLTADLKNIEKAAENNNPPPEKQSLEDEALEKIKKTLNPNFKPKREKQIYIPDEIEQITETIISLMTENEIVTKETAGLHYGKKFKFTLGHKQAEINLFYGKKVYTVVISPRNGTTRNSIKFVNNYWHNILCNG